MGFMIAYGHCFGCSKLFGFNPQCVPSFRVNGKREPVCKSCIKAANTKRKEMGLPPHVINPDAYEPEPV